LIAAEYGHCLFTTRALRAMGSRRKVLGNIGQFVDALVENALRERGRGLSPEEADRLGAGLQDHRRRTVRPADTKPKMLVEWEIRDIHE
jgi:hypothetical protein